MTPLRIIGLCGNEGAGKDTAAALLAKHAGFAHVAFADALRAEIASAFSIDIDLLTERSTKETPMPALALQRCADHDFEAALFRALVKAEPGQCVLLDMTAPRSPRQIMRWWATEYRRAKDPAYWVKALRSRIVYLAEKHRIARFAIADVRFLNESDLVRIFNGWIWQIRSIRAPSRAGEHVSATDGTEFKPNLVLSNDHDIRHLQGLVLQAWWELESGLRIERLELAA